MLEKFERYPLTFGPTPIEKLERLSAHLGGGVSLYAKREDCNSGLAFGGNKVRKLEYIVPDALASNADTLVTIGGVQSNHTRQVAAVAAKLGMKCRLVQESWVPFHDAVYDRVGNILLSRVMGAEIELVDEGFDIGIRESWENAMQSVRDAAPNVPVGVRISQTKVNDLTYVWPDGDDDAKVVFPAIAATGIDFFDCSAHLGLDHVFGTDRSLSGLARRHTGLPVFANGKLHDPELADRAIAEEEGDFVAIAKGALADPEWPQKIAAGLEPVPFNPAMVMPFATLDCNEAFWKENPSGVPDEPVVARDGVES